MRKFLLFVFLLSTGITVATARDHLADFHEKNEGVKCARCHVEDTKKIADSQKDIDNKCMSCHESKEELAKEDLAKKPISVHKSHLVDIGCTGCHSGHTEPVMVCVNCHTSFQDIFKMPFATAKLKPTRLHRPVSAEEINKAIQGGPVASYDLVVIEGGATGFASAVQARQAGIKSIMIFEKESMIGGSSQLSAGGYNAVYSTITAKNRVEDSIELYHDDTMKGGRYLNDPDLVRTLAEQSGSGIDWLIALGADMSSTALNSGLSAPRQHRPAKGGQNGPMLVGTLKKAADSLGIPYETNNKVHKITQDKFGRVSGVVVQGRHSGVRFVAAKAVVLATGGFGWNNEMIVKYRPDLKNAPSTNNPGSMGEGIKMAEDLGAKFVDLEHIQTFPTSTGEGRLLVSGTALSAGAILINREGIRPCAIS